MLRSHIICDLYCCINAKISHAKTSSIFIVFWSYLAYKNSMSCKYLSGSRDKALFFLRQGIFITFLVFLTQNHNYTWELEDHCHTAIFFIQVLFSSVDHCSFTPVGNKTLFFPFFLSTVYTDPTSIKIKITVTSANSSPLSDESSQTI